MALSGDGRHGTSRQCHRQPSWPVLAGDALYVAAGDGGLRAFDATAGTRWWGFQTGGDLTTAPVVAGGRVYVGSANGNV